MKAPRPYRPKVTHYVLDGRRVQKSTKGARPVHTQSQTWYARLGGEPVSLGTTDESIAWKRLRELQGDALNRQLGIHTDAHDAARLPLHDHLDDWGKALADKGTEAETIATAKAHVRKLATLAGWPSIASITFDSAQAALAVLQNELSLSARTRNHHAAHLRQFCRWLARTRPRRLAENPVEGLPEVSEEADRRHPRRCPTDEEFSRLFGWLYDPAAKTRTGRRLQPRHGLTGAARALGYKVCMATGLRASELRSLSRQSFRLDVTPPTVTVAAGYAKRRRLDTLPLPGWLVDELRTHFAAGGDCWQSLPESHPGDVLQRDLADAGIPYALPGADGADEYFDMHSLRVYYCTVLADQPNISIKTLMELCRHSTPDLTIRLYAKRRQGSVEAAVNAIPAPPRKHG